jgi:hypothetical protein
VAASSVSSAAFCVVSVWLLLAIVVVDPFSCVGPVGVPDDRVGGGTTFGDGVLLLLLLVFIIALLLLFSNVLKSKESRVDVDVAAGTDTNGGGVVVVVVVVVVNHGLLD